MDELVISGKRFISSRSAAREHGYHSDYIGQLIRGGKVRGQKVGRAWYVDAESLESYLQKESSVGPATDAAVRATIPQPIAESVKVSVQPEPEKIPEPEIHVEAIAQKIPEPAQSIETIVLEPEPAEVPEANVFDLPADTHTIPIHAAAPEPLRSTLTYVVDEPIPTLSPKKVMPRVPYESPDMPRTRSWRASQVGGLAALAVTIFVVSAYLSSALATTVAAGQGMTATSGYALE